MNTNSKILLLFTAVVAIAVIGGIRLKQNNKGRSQIVFSKQDSTLTQASGLNEQILSADNDKLYDDEQQKTFFTKSFDDYKVGIENIKAAPIDFQSSNFARTHKTSILEIYKHGVNFAGHYSLATWGCGSPCVMSAITDLKTGKVIQGPDSESGINFHSNSKLIIVNPPDSLGNYDNSSLFTKPKFYVLDSNILKEIVK